MIRHRSPAQDVARLWLSLTLGLAAPLTGPALGRAADPAKPGQPPASQPVAAPRLLVLTDAVQLAVAQHPRVVAARASLAAAEDGKQALDALHVPTFLDRELPVRRRQADLGVAAAQAELARSEREAAYGATHSYFTVLYARQQERVARRVVGRLTTLLDSVQQALDAGDKEVTSADLNRTKTYRNLAEARRIEAEEGARRALAALREAVGFEPCDAVDVPSDPLPEPDARPCRDDIVAAALAYRGELAQTALFGEAVRLEVDAQRTSLLKRVDTFAAGSDIHAGEVPPAVRDNEYRPGAVPPEMPAQLAGGRGGRVRHADSLAARAEAAAAANRGLIALEADDAFLRWEQASRQAAAAHIAADSGDLLADDLEAGFRARHKVRVEDVINALALAAQARSQYQEYLYGEILALADLERVTGGAFHAGLEHARVAEAAKPAPKDDRFGK
jgi:outer membrane protein TolC